MEVNPHPKGTGCPRQQEAQQLEHESLAAPLLARHLAAKQNTCRPLPCEVQINQFLIYARHN